MIGNHACQHCTLECGVKYSFLFYVTESEKTIIYKNWQLGTSLSSKILLNQSITTYFYFFFWFKLFIFYLQAETANLNEQLNEKLLETTGDGFHEDQLQLQVSVLITY